MPEDPSKLKSHNLDEAFDTEQAGELSKIESSEKYSGPSLPKAAVDEEPKKSKKGRTVALVLALIFILLGVTGTVYAFWYQSPDKVLADGLVNAVTARSVRADGTVKYVDEKQEFNLTFDSRGDYDSGSTLSANFKLKDKEANTEINLQGDTIFATNGDIYFRLVNIDKVYEQFMEVTLNQMTERLEAGSEGQIPQEFIDAAHESFVERYRPVVEKVENKWVKITPADLKRASVENGKLSECINKSFKEFSQDQNAITHLGTSYAQNRFLVIKESLGVKNGSIGYVMDFDENVAKKFKDELVKNPIFKRVDECIKDASEDSAYVVPLSEQGWKKSDRTELWFDQWKHNITAIKTEVAQKKDNQTKKLTAEIRPNFNIKFDVKMPSDSIPFTDILDDIRLLSILPDISKGI